MSKILQFKITLKHVEPKIWRRFLIRDTISFRDLHNVILSVMGWDGGHLHQFAFGKYDLIGDPEALGDEGVGDESKIQVKKLFDKPKMKCTYEYDFGDGWEHDLVLEKISEEDEKMTYARCIEGENNCPPEDIGGPWGFMETLEMLKLPKKKRDKDAMEWLGDYDPAYFDLEDINAQLHRRSS